MHLIGCWVAIEASLYTILSGAGGVTALAGTRIYPLLIPQEAALPALAYQRISGRRTMAHDGPITLTRARVQITCVAETYSQAKSLAAAVQAALDGYRGTVGSHAILHAFLDNDLDEYGETTELPAVRQDYLILYKE